MSFFSVKKSGRALVKMTAMLALLVGVSAAGLKYVAVVETDVDAQSGASAGINPAEVREITAELRRQASQNLPLGKYSVMTAETIQSMGGAVLEECAEENCVIALGSRIGADYIVRGTISKFQTKFTLAVELYETDNGTLIVSSDAVRSESLVELLDMAATASAKMYKIFVDGQKNAHSAQEPAANEVAPHANMTVTALGGSEKPLTRVAAPRKKNSYFSVKYNLPDGLVLEWGKFIDNSMFWTLDAGMDADVDVGIGFNYGYIFNLPHDLRVIAGLSAGYWLNKGDNDLFYRSSRDLFGPFLKVQWKYVEIMYRGLLGNYKEYLGSTNIDEGFGWNQNKFMIGIFFKY